MKKIILACALTILLSLPVQAASPFVRSGGLKNGLYFAIRAGGSDLTIKSDGEKDHKSSLLWINSLGARLNRLRLEAEWTNFARARFEDAKIRQQRYMLQAYYDIPVRLLVRPFVNVGAGAAYTEADIEGSSDNHDDTTFAWNAGAGLGINITSRISFDVGYRYFDAGKARMIKDSARQRLTGHEGYAGVRISF